MLTLAVDPGIRRANPAGWVLLDSVAHTEDAIVDCGVVQPPTKLVAWEDRVDYLTDAVARVLDEQQSRGRFVSALASESAFVKPRPGGKFDATVYAKQTIVSWELRKLAQLRRLIFTLIRPDEQSSMREQLPQQLLDAATSHVVERHRQHVASAAAIAWLASARVQQQLLAVEMTGGAR